MLIRNAAAVYHTPYDACEKLNNSKVEVLVVCLQWIIPTRWWSIEANSWHILLMPHTICMQNKNSRQITFQCRKTHHMTGHIQSNTFSDLNTTVLPNIVLWLNKTHHMTCHIQSQFLFRVEKLLSNTVLWLDKTWVVTSNHYSFSEWSIAYTLESFYEIGNWSIISFSIAFASTKDFSTNS